MARIRTIKPDFPQSESMGRVSRESRLLFILLWTLCDDAGRLRGNSRILASLLYPYDDDAQKHIEKWLLELEKENCIVRYKADGGTYVEVLNWLKHQKIDKPSPSKIPPFTDDSRILANIPDTVDKGRLGREGKGRDKEGNGEEGNMGEDEQKILSSINEVLGKSFKGSKEAMGNIRKRVKEGRSFQDFITVCQNMQYAWGSDPKMSQYLCPETLCGEKFDKYLNTTPVVAPNRHIKTIEEIKMDNTKRAIEEFAGGENDRSGQAAICIDDGRSIGSVPARLQ